MFGLHAARIAYSERHRFYRPANRPPKIDDLDTTAEQRIGLFRSELTHAFFAKSVGSIDMHLLHRHAVVIGASRPFGLLPTHRMAKGEHPIRSGRFFQNAFHLWIVAITDRVVILELGKLGRTIEKREALDVE